MTFIYPKNRQELREWFFAQQSVTSAEHEANASTEKEVFVHCIRRDHERIIPYLDVVEEALCFGWIDSTTRSNPDGEGYFQRLTPRRKGSYWTELYKERCRRLIKLGLMTPAGKKVLPSLAKNSFKPDAWILDEIRKDKQAWKNHKTFHPLYVRVRLYNVMFYWKRNGKGDHETALKMLDRYIRAAHDGKMIGEWNDGGRLLEY